MVVVPELRVWRLCMWTERLYVSVYLCSQEFAKGDPYIRDMRNTE